MLPGVSGVVLTRERSAPLGGTAAKSSAGAISHIDICQVTNLAESLKQLKEAGAWIFGAVKDATAQSIFTTDFALPACLVVGGEGQGIRPLVRKQCDVLVSIPMVGTLDSLNSSVAAGIIMFEMLRQTISVKSKKDRSGRSETCRNPTLVVIFLFRQALPSAVLRGCRFPPVFSSLSGWPGIL